MKVLSKIPLNIATYTASTTLVKTDAGKLVVMNVGTSNNLTVPLNSSVNFEVGTQIFVNQKGVGVTTIVAYSGVTINNETLILTQNRNGKLVKIATNEWNFELIKDVVVSDATISLTDITTNDVSTSKHGFVPKAPNDTSKSLLGDGTWGKINANVQSVTSSSTVTATNLNDLVDITALATNVTLANPTGTFVNGQVLIYRILDNGTLRNITFGTSFNAFSTLPTATTVNKTMYIYCVYNSNISKFDVINSKSNA